MSRARQANAPSARRRRIAMAKPKTWIGRPGQAPFELPDVSGARWVWRIEWPCGNTVTGLSFGTRSHASAQLAQTLARQRALGFGKTDGFANFRVARSRVRVYDD